MKFENDRVEAESVKDFLERYYRPDRYHGRGEDYAASLLASHEAYFERHGYDVISRHDSVMGKVVVYFGANAEPWEMPRDEYLRGVAEEVGYTGDMSLAAVNKAVRDQVAKSNALQDETNRQLDEFIGQGLTRREAWDKVRDGDAWKEWLTPTPDLNRIQNARSVHWLAVRDAVVAGEAVSSHVLADYDALKLIWDSEERD